MPSTVVLELLVPGNPQPKQRPRVYRGRGVTPPATVAAEAHLAHLARAAMTAPPAEGPLRVTYHFRRGDRRPADWDNLAKLVGDALNGVAWVDDKQVVEAAVTVERGCPDPSTYIRVETLSD